MKKVCPTFSANYLAGDLWLENISQDKYYSRVIFGDGSQFIVQLFIIFNYSLELLVDVPIFLKYKYIF